MTRLQRLQRRLHEIRRAGGTGSILVVNGTPFLAFTRGDSETTATRILAKQKPVLAVKRERALL